MAANHIHEYVLLGISNVLKEKAPDLLPVIDRIKTGGRYQPTPSGGTSSDYKIIEAYVPMADAMNVNEALENVVRKEGRAITYQGWHVDFLAICWRRFAGV